MIHTFEGVGSMPTTLLPSHTFGRVKNIEIERIPLRPVDIHEPSPGFDPASFWSAAHTEVVEARFNKMNQPSLLILWSETSDATPLQKWSQLESKSWLFARVNATIYVGDLSSSTTKSIQLSCSLEDNVMLRLTVPPFVRCTFVHHDICVAIPEPQYSERLVESSKRSRGNSR